MTALQRALDLEAMQDVLATTAEVEPGEAPGSWTVQVASYKPRKRWTLRYTFAPDDARVVEGASVIGKLYVRKARAGSLVDRMQALRKNLLAPDGVSIPAPLAALPELGLALQQRAHGDHLGTALLEGKADEAVRLAAHWLAALHGTAPLPGLPVKTIGHELRKVAGWVEQIAPVLPTGEARRLRRTERRLRRTAEAWPRSARTMIHRDFYYGNLFWDGVLLSVLDLDDLSLGDPALDVGHFLSHLAKLGYFASGRSDLLENAGDRFREAYAERAPLDDGRVQFFRSYTLLKLAATEVQRKQGDWSETARVLGELASLESGRGAAR